MEFLTGDEYGKKMIHDPWIMGCVFPMVVSYKL